MWLDTPTHIGTQVALPVFHLHLLQMMYPTVSPCIHIYMYIETVRHARHNVRYKRDTGTGGRRSNSAAAAAGSLPSSAVERLPQEQARKGHY